MNIEDKVITVSKNNNQQLISARFREGKTDAQFFWWGVRIWLSKSTLVGIGGGYSIAGILIPLPLLSKMFAGTGIVLSSLPGGIVFNTTSAVITVVYWGFEWQ